MALLRRSTPLQVAPVLSLPIVRKSETLLEGQEKKYTRTWNKKQIQEVYSKTIDYCERCNKNIEHLELADFQVISCGLDQSPQQVMLKVNEIHKTGTLRPGIWSPDEDSVLAEMMTKGISWGKISKAINEQQHKNLRIRSGKQCKERWNNYLNPDINRGPWEYQEDLQVLQLYKEHGKKWSNISKMTKNRTESAVKNRVKSLLNKIKQELKSLDDINFGIDKYIEKLLLKIECKRES
jgi:RNA polymerase-binding transcription factor DksA